MDFQAYELDAANYDEMSRLGRGAEGASIPLHETLETTFGRGTR